MNFESEENYVISEHSPFLIIHVSYWVAVWMIVNCVWQNLRDLTLFISFRCWLMVMWWSQIPSPYFWFVFAYCELVKQTWKFQKMSLRPQFHIPLCYNACYILIFVHNLWTFILISTWRKIVMEEHYYQPILRKEHWISRWALISELGMIISRCLSYLVCWGLLMGSGLCNHT